MPKGESSREKVRWQIQKFLFNNPATSSKIVEACKAAKATVYKYLNELVEEGKVIWNPRRKRGESTYELSDEAKNSVKALLLRDDLYDLTSDFDTKWLEILRRLLRNMRKRGTDPSEYFKHSCIAFVGGLPYTFGKSQEAFQVHVIDFESRLERNGRREGLTKEEYWRKKLKEAEKLKGARRIATILGYTKEEIEEMRKRQGGTFKVRRIPRKKG